MGFYLSKLTAPANPTSSLAGRVYVVTGGAAGIGHYTSLNLLLRGATVLVGGRTPSKITAVIAEWERAHPQLVGRAHSFLMDFDTLAGARAGAERVLELVSQHGLHRLDGLCNNAGRLILPHEMSPDGIELVQQVNHFGTFTFTQTLLPLLIKTAKQPDSDVRIVVLASTAHYYCPALKLENAASFEKICGDTLAKRDSYQAQFRRYAVSKLFNVLFTAELQRVLAEQGANIACVAVHPGTVATDKLLVYPWPITPLLQMFAFSPPQGALTTLFALTDPAVKAQPQTYNGKYLEPFASVTAPSKQGADILLARKLWEITEQVVRAGGVKA